MPDYSDILGPLNALLGQPKLEGKDNGDGTWTYTVKARVPVLPSIKSYTPGRYPPYFTSEQEFMAYVLGVLSAHGFVDAQEEQP